MEIPDVRRDEIIPALERRVERARDAAFHAERWGTGRASIDEARDEYIAAACLLAIVKSRFDLEKPLDRLPLEKDR
jgi:hypothetical protein